MSSFLFFCLTPFTSKHDTYYLTCSNTRLHSNQKPQVFLGFTESKCVSFCSQDQTGFVTLLFLSVSLILPIHILVSVVCNNGVNLRWSCTNLKLVHDLFLTQSDSSRLISARLAPSAPHWSRRHDYCDGNPIRPIPWIPRNPLSCHLTPAAIVNTHCMPHTPTMSSLIPIAGMSTSLAVPLLQKHGR